MSATMNWDRNRKITERWIIEGQLELVTPTSLGNGDDDPLVDLPVVVDPLEGKALLTGASLAGALRSYLADFDKACAMALFGGMRGDEKGAQSPLIVEDALGDKPLIELRDGVSIDPTTRTAKDKEKYDRQLLAAGTRFGAGFELIVSSRPVKDEKGKIVKDGAGNVVWKDDLTNLRPGLAQALYGLQKGDIRLGGRKRRGYGECRVISWRAWRYDLRTPDGLKAWLAHDRAGFEADQVAPWTWASNGQSDGGILDWQELADVVLPTRKLDFFQLKAEFNIGNSVLIRSGFETETGPDASHLRSLRNGEEVPVMSGTSLAGVIRGQALRIALTVAGPEFSETAESRVNDLFGYMQKPKKGITPAERRRLKKHAGRVMVDESVITDSPKDIVQSRVKIDRFTGGAYESALFAEQPAFGGKFQLNLSLRQPKPAEIGLLLLVLKDLWTGFIAVGGGSSVGRGRLTGQTTTLTYGKKTWQLTADGDSLQIVTSGDAQTQDLNDFVDAVKTHVRSGGEDGGD
jgi:CRISPR/Cas system CSM-associated protein Csm3 (group 7 of RAMP superfamily)